MQQAPSSVAAELSYPMVQAPTKIVQQAAPHTTATIAPMNVTATSSPQQNQQQSLEELNKDQLIKFLVAKLAKRGDLEA